MAHYWRPFRAESLGLITNYRCTFRCRHCLYCAAPSIREEPDEERLDEIVNHLAEVLGRVPIHVGGGEPLLYIDRIEKLTGFCSGLRLGEESAENLAGLYERGLDLGRYPALEMLLQGGLRALYGHALDRGYEPDAAGYGSSCHLCLELRVFLYHQVCRFPEFYPDFLYEDLGPLPGGAPS